MILIYILLELCTGVAVEHKEGETITGIGKEKRENHKVSQDCGHVNFLYDIVSGHIITY